MKIVTHLNKELIDSNIYNDAIVAWSDYMNILMKNNSQNIELVFDIDEDKQNYVDEFFNYIFEAQAVQVMQHD